MHAQDDRVDRVAPKLPVAVAGPVIRPSIEPAHLKSRMTRTEDLFVLAHLAVPEVDEKSWSLEICGRVGRNLTISFADLLALPKRSLESFIECAGNPFNPTEASRQIANVKWGGADLKALLNELHVDASATHLWAYGLEHGAFAGDEVAHYIKDLPLSCIEQGDVFLLGGDPLRGEYVGEPLAALCAESPAEGADACDFVEADYEPLPVVADAEMALAPGAPLLHDSVPGNLLFRRDFSNGDVDGAFARAAVVLRETFRHGRVSASPLEPRGIVAVWEAGRLTVWTGTQAPHIYRAALARAFQLSESEVRIIVPDTGGGFGQKMHVLPEDLAVAALARVAGRPVKWIETRRENLAAASQAREGRVDIEAAADPGGGERQALKPPPTTPLAPP